MKEKIKKNKEEIIVVLIFIFFAIGFSYYRVQGDGYLYYSFLERMLNIANPESSPEAIKNTYFFQSGCVYFNAPFYLVAYLIENMFHINWNFNGITLRQIAINLASIFYLSFSLILVVRILKKLNFKYKILPTISILFTTSAFSTATVIPSFNHAADIFVTTLFVFLLLECIEKKPTKSFWLGVSIVIATLVRYFNIFLLLPVFIYYLWFKENKKLAFLVTGLIGIGWLIPLILYTYNGIPFPLVSIENRLTSISMKTISSIGYASLTPKYILRLVVHPLHGLFVWSPATIFSALGLIFAPKGKEKLGYLFIGFWLVFLILYGLFPFWHAGWSFSNRYLVNLFPIYIIGLSTFLERFGKKMILPTIIVSLYSIILYLNWHLNIMNGEFGTPGDMLRAWIKGESTTFVDKTVNLKVVLNRLWEFCRYKYIFRIFR